MDFQFCSPVTLENVFTSSISLCMRIICPGIRTWYPSMPSSTFSPFCHCGRSTHIPHEINAPNIPPRHAMPCNAIPMQRQCPQLLFFKCQADRCPFVANSPIHSNPFQSSQSSSQSQGFRCDFLVGSVLVSISHQLRNLI